MAISGGAFKREKFKWGKFAEAHVNALKNSTHKINIWQGSVRSGKTISSIVRWLQFVQECPANYNLLMVGKTDRALKRNILDVIIQIVGPKNAVYKFGTGEFVLFGRVIYVVGANDERSSDKIRGISLGGCYCDEVSLYPESFFRMLSTRLSEPGAKMFATTNPDSPYHWLKTDYIDRESEGVCRVFSFTLDDNPNLDPDYVLQLKKEFTGLWYDRFIKGKWVLAEGAVYDMWDEKKHSFSFWDKMQKEGREHFRHYVVGVDYGTNNPCAFVLIGFDTYDGPKHVVKEYYYTGRGGKQKTDAEYRQDLIQFMDGFKISSVVIDPSAASFKAELSRHGVITRDADNSILDGIRFVSSLMTKDQLLIDVSCHWLRKEFSAYVWDENSQKKGVDIPAKAHDHLLDAMRYALYTVFGKGMQGVIGGAKKK